MKYYPRISIVMPTFMHGIFIDRAVKSVINQTFQDWELIIINDGSSDNTEEVIGNYKNDKRIHYFYQKNAGVSFARNEAVKKSRGELIAYLDSDDIFLSNHLQVRIDVLNKTKTDFVFGPVFVVKSSGKEIYHGELSDSNTACVLPLMVMHKKYCFDVGTFNSSVVFEEDLELFFRMSKRFKVHQFFSSITAEYYVHDKAVHRIFERDGIKGVSYYRKKNKKE